MGCFQFVHRGEKLADATGGIGVTTGGWRNLGLDSRQTRCVVPNGCHERKKLGLGALGQTARLLQFGSKLLNVLFNHDRK